MKLVLQRKYRNNNYCIDKLYINNIYLSDVLEDPDRGLQDFMSLEEIKRIKVKGNTCIPYGTYNITITYSPRFKKNLPLLNNVKGFDGIRIHSGNKPQDTEGCLLPGFNKVKGQVIDSRVTTDKLIAQIQQALNKGEKVTITITK